MTGQAEEWIKQADYDLGTADAMFRSRRYIYAIFMCHLCLEKALKGLLAKHGAQSLQKVTILFFSSTGVGLTCRSHTQSFWKC